MDKILLVTASGDRWPSIQLVLSFMKRQDYPGPIEWIISDDSAEPYFIPENLGKIRIHHIYRGPCPKIEEGHVSLSKNLIATLEVAQGMNDVGMIAVIGDDDWYRADYLSIMRDRLGVKGAAGHKRVIYGYPPIGMKQLNNKDHAGLESTVFKPELIPLMIAANLETIKDLTRWADWRFWKKVHEQRIPHNLFEWEFPAGVAMVSLKGKNRRGRYGVGDLHNYNAKDHRLGQVIPSPDIEAMLREAYFFE